jgi:hypothetical protein
MFFHRKHSSPSKLKLHPNIIIVESLNLKNGGVIYSLVNNSKVTVSLSFFKNNQAETVRTL